MVDFEGWSRPLSAFALIVVAGCSEKGDGDGSGGTTDSDGAMGSLNGAGAPADGTRLRIEGAFQKGPLVAGSPIRLSALDARLVPTGQVVDAQTNNDRGEFTLSVAGGGPVMLKGEGVYYNELSGEVSGWSIALRALYAPSGTDTQQVNVNLITHLTTERVGTLVTGGAPFPEAVAQAEEELLRELAITDATYTPSVPATRMNLVGADNDDNAYLLGLSATMMQFASDRSKGAGEATLQETLNVIALDLIDGTLRDERKEEIHAALARLDLPAVNTQLAERLSQIGTKDNAPDPNRVLDQDGDGVANARDVCPFVSDSQVDSDGDGKGDACDPCPTAACEPCLPADPDNGGPAMDTCVNPGAGGAGGAGGDGAGGAGAAAGDGGDGGNGGADPTGGPGGADPTAGAAGTDTTGAGGTSADGPTPTGGAGQPCRADGSCNSGLDCAADATGCGATSCCVPAGGVGEPCIGGPSGSCNAGLNCLGGPVCAQFDLDSCCMPPGGEGEACSNDPQQPIACDQGLVCLTGEACDGTSCCRAPGGLHSTCLEGATCNGDLVCDTSVVSCDNGQDSCCLEPRQGGGPCVRSTACAAGFACVNDNDSCNGGLCCLPAGGLGQPCPNDLPCGEGLVCDSCADFDEGCCFLAP